ncbi:hypothetical protein TrRE_jg10547 [Triparma retinervis]|uniref:Uncharacterized protein n=1 Tax=Triparma retinervis TaxID=2557542 RepID=A0A9W7A1J3_9STRA|nr:hypothetical protein TrRE_jg10547 [Triparma retinervis]
MVFSMSFMTEDDLAREEEEIGGEMVELEEGSFLYIHRSAFMKLLGSSCQLDVKGEVEFIDKEGFKINPNV